MNIKRIVACVVAIATMSTMSVSVSADQFVQLQSESNYGYQYDNGKYAFNKFIKASNSYYYFDNDGKMVTGWYVHDDGIRYYSSNGKMATGLTKVGKSYYFFDKKDGTMKTSKWVKTGNNVYYCGTYGAITKQMTYAEYQSKQSGKGSSSSSSATEKTSTPDNIKSGCKIKESNKYYDLELTKCSINYDKYNTSYAVFEYKLDIKSQLAKDYSRLPANWTGDGTKMSDNSSILSFHLQRIDTQGDAYTLGVIKYSDAYDYVCVADDVNKGSYTIRIGYYISDMEYGRKDTKEYRFSVQDNLLMVDDNPIIYGVLEI